nr:PREDICTED: uncharacterized protein LOC109038885 [Bemisia tabaci]XP_018909681.1 PREDICTED: uncharacterized protein LOC109038885 [Bemisia tabaci]XP_018909682.1 PREDICTED: uncharacterized protein LOC109038885 [Bemisia tabaci]
MEVSSDRRRNDLSQRKTASKKMQTLSQDGHGETDKSSESLSRSGKTQNPKVKKRAIEVVTQSSGTTCNALSTESAKAKKIKLRNLSHQTGNTFKIALNPISVPDDSIVKVEREDSSNLSCTEEMEVSDSVVVSNNIRIKQEMEESNEDWQHDLNCLWEPVEIEHCEQNVNPSSNVSRLENTIAGEEIENSSPALNSPEYNGSSKRTLNYVKMYREGTLRAMADIANEHAALAAKSNDPVEPVQPKKIIPLEFLDKKPKVSDQMKLSILEEAKTNFEEATLKQSNNPIEPVQARKITPRGYLGKKPKFSHQIKLSILEEAKANFEGATFKQSNNPVEPVRARKTIPRGVLAMKPKVSHEIKLTILKEAKTNFAQIASCSKENDEGKIVTSVMSKQDGRRQSYFTEPSLGNLPSLKESIDLRKPESFDIIDKTEIEECVKVFIKEEPISEEFIEQNSVGSETEFSLKHCNDEWERHSDFQVLEDDEKLRKCAQVARKLAQTLKAGIEWVKPLVDEFDKKKMKRISKKDKEESILECKLAILKIDKAQKLALKHLCIVHFLNPINKNVNSLMHPNSENKEDKVEELSRRMAEFSEIVDTLANKKEGKKLSQELKESVKLLETVKLFEKSVKEELAILEKDTPKSPPKSPPKSLPLKDVSKNKRSRRSKRTIKKEKMSEPCVKGLSLDKVHVMPSQLLKIATLSKNFYPQRIKKSWELEEQEREEKMKLEQEMAKQQLAAMNLSSECVQKGKSLTKHAQTTEIVIKINTAEEKVTNAQSKKSPKHSKMLGQKSSSRIC